MMNISSRLQNLDHFYISTPHLPVEISKNGMQRGDFGGAKARKCGSQKTKGAEKKLHKQKLGNQFENTNDLQLQSVCI